jgi:hypothetical protein
MPLWNLNTWAEFAEIVFKIGALILAGGWTVFAFYTLKEREKSAAELRKITLDAKKLEHDLRRLAVVQTEISASSHSSPDGVGYFIFADVVLKNSGAEETRIEWEGNPPVFSIHQASFADNGSPLFTKPPIKMRVMQARNPKAKAVSLVLRAGGTERLNFAAFVPQSGVYLLSFRAVLNRKDRLVSVETGTDPGNPVSWTARKYVMVAKRTDNSWF